MAAPKRTSSRDPRRPSRRRRPRPATQRTWLGCCATRPTRANDERSQTAPGFGACGQGEGLTVEAHVLLHVDGRSVELDLDPRTSLLDALRERLGNPSPKKGCDHGQCGACTVLLDGRRALSCLALAVAHDGATITTAAGLAAAGDGDLHEVQQAIVDCDALQCGYCTPGQICSAVGMLRDRAGMAERGDGRSRGRSRADGWRGRRADEREPLPLRYLREHRDRCPAGQGAGVKPFTYTRADDPADAVRRVTGEPAATFLAGGTNLVDHLRLGVARPDVLVDVRTLTSQDITDLPAGGLRVGAAVTNSDLAADPRVRRQWPAD